MIFEMHGAKKEKDIPLVKSFTNCRRFFTGKFGVIHCQLEVGSIDKIEPAICLVPFSKLK